MADYGLLWYMRPRPPSLPRSTSQVAAKNATLFELHTELNILTGKPLQGLDQYDDVRAYAPVSDRGPSVAGVRSGGGASGGGKARPKTASGTGTRRRGRTPTSPTTGKGGGKDGGKDGGGGRGDDESYEAVLKQELVAMRQAYEKKLDKANKGTKRAKDQNGTLERMNKSLETKITKLTVAASRNRGGGGGGGGGHDDGRYARLQEEYEQLEERAQARENALQSMHRLEASIFADPSGRPRCTPERLEELYALRRHAWSAAQKTSDARGVGGGGGV